MTHGPINLRLKQLHLIEDVKAGGEKLSAIDDTEKVASFLLMITET